MAALGAGAGAGAGAPTWLGLSMRRNWKPDLVMTGELSWDSSVVIRPAWGWWYRWWWGWMGWRRWKVWRG